MTRRRYRRKTGFSPADWMRRIMGTFGKNRRYHETRPDPKAFGGPARREPGRAGRTLKRAGGRMVAALRRIPRRALVLGCVAVAVAVTFISVSAYGGGNAAGQEAAASETSGEAAPETSAAPDAALVSPEPTPSPSPKSTETAAPDPLGGVVYEEGMSGAIISSVQQRLMDLNYMNEDEPTELYGPLTRRAVTAFQRQAELPMDGLLATQTFTALMDADAPIFAVSLGAQGADVEDMVYRLYELGYMDTAPETFTEDVRIAVQRFQEENGLDVDGIIGANTRNMLYSGKAKGYGDDAPEDGGGAVNLTMSVTQETNVGPGSLEGVLSSSLSGLGQALYDGEQNYGINSLFVLAIINYESGYGTSNLAQSQNNLGGLKSGGSYKTFSSKAECVDYMYDLLSRNYIGNGLTTIEAIGEVYCGGTWAAEIKGYMQELIAQL